MNFIRVFHPVGQGAFYSERHIMKDNEYTIIYDCGSDSLSDNKMEKKIKATFPPNYVVDVLFISHFHADHISGINALKRYCRIKKVVIPLINNRMKTLIKAANFLNEGYTDTGIIDNPDDYFGNGVPIIRIKEVPKKEKKVLRENDSVEREVLLDEIGSSGTYESGTRFKFNKSSDWFFIPYNYQQSIRKKQFLNALYKLKLNLKDMNSIDKILKNKRSIKEAYESVTGDLNTNSLVLFSGDGRTQGELKCSSVRFYPWDKYIGVTKTGCLYLGDANLNEENIIDDIKKRLGYLYSNIGTIQIPHHGSVHNFNNLIFDGNIDHAALSFGLINKYSHPSDKVISEIIANNINVHLITEMQDSIFVQWQ